MSKFLTGTWIPEVCWQRLYKPSNNNTITYEFDHDAPSNMFETSLPVLLATNKTHQGCSCTWGWWYHLAANESHIHDPQLLQCALHYCLPATQIIRLYTQIKV